VLARSGRSPLRPSRERVSGPFVPRSGWVPPVSVSPEPVPWTHVTCAMFVIVGCGLHTPYACSPCGTRVVCGRHGCGDWYSVYSTHHMPALPAEPAYPAHAGAEQAGGGGGERRGPLRSFCGPKNRERIQRGGHAAAHKPGGPLRAPAGRNRPDMADVVRRLWEVRDRAWAAPRRTRRPTPAASARSRRPVFGHVSLPQHWLRGSRESSTPGSGTVDSSAASFSVEPRTGDE